FSFGDAPNFDFSAFAGGGGGTFDFGNNTRSSGSSSSTSPAFRLGLDLGASKDAKKSKAQPSPSEDSLDAKQSTQAADGKGPAATTATNDAGNSTPSFTVGSVTSANASASCECLRA